MNPLTLLAIALALSMGGNVLQGWMYLGVRDDLARAEADRDQARGAAKTCSDSVTELQRLAAERNQEATRFRAKAESEARTHEGRAQQLLAAAPAVPGDDCRSAGAAIDAWLHSRRKP